MKRNLINNTLFTPPRQAGWRQPIAGLGLALLFLAGAGGAAAQPANDAFANAINLPGDNGSASGYDNIGATFQAGEPICGISSGYAVVTNTVWFKWTATSSGLWTISTAGSKDDTGAEWDGIFCLYTGASLDTLFPMKKTGWWDVYGAIPGIAGPEIATIPVTAGTTYYVQLGADAIVWQAPGVVVTNLALTWSFVVLTPTVVDISNDATPVDPGNPAGGVAIGSIVGIGNTGRLVGLTQTHWASEGYFYVNMDLNGNTLIVDTGGGNAPYYAYGDISGNGTVAFNTTFYPYTTIQVRGHNTYSGSTDVHGGYISLENPDGQDALLGPIIVGSLGPAALVWTTAGNQINDAADVTLVTSGSFLDLNGFAETFHSLTLPAGTSVSTGVATGNYLRVTTLTLGGTTYTTNAFGADTPGGYITGSGYILVGGTPPPVITDPPTAPSVPVPNDGTTGIYPFGVSLSWASSLRATSYDLYYWLASGSKPSTPNVPGLRDVQYALPVLANDAAYNWQVVANDSVGSTPGPVWTFTTISRSDVSGTIVNPNAQIGIGNGANLIGPTDFDWQTGDCAINVTNNGYLFTMNTGGNPYDYTGVISGSGGLEIFTGATPPLRIGGSSGNTYSGPTTVDYGTVSLEKSSGNALLGSITVGSAGLAVLVWTADDQISDASDVTLVAVLSTLQLGSFTDTIKSLTMVPGTQVDTTGGGVLTVSSLTINGVPQPSGIYGPDGIYVLGEGHIVVLAAALELPLSGFTLPGGRPTFAIPNTVSTSTYTLFYKNNLTDATWTALTDSGTGAGNGGTLILSDPTSSLPAQRFYRLGVQ